MGYVKVNKRETYKNVIAKTKELLGPNGEHWVKGTYKTQRWELAPNFCLIGALRHAELLTVNESSELEYELTSIMRDCADTIAPNVWEEMYWDDEVHGNRIRTVPVPYENVEAFNDHNDTTFVKILEDLNCTLKHIEEIPADAVIEVYQSRSSKKVDAPWTTTKTTTA